MNGPGDIVAGLAPPQDNLPAYLARAQFGRPKLHPYEEERIKRQKAAEGLDEGGSTGTISKAAESGNANVESAEAAGKDANTTAPEEGGQDQPGQMYLPLVGYILSSWARNKRARDTLEARFLACLWARRGEYPDTELAGMWTVDAGAGSPIYLPLAASKMRSCEAAMRDLLLPTGQRPWGVTPVPLSKLPEFVMEKLVEQATEKAQQAMAADAEASGQPMDRTIFAKVMEQYKTELHAASLESARKEAIVRARKMEDVIAKRMDEGNYYQAIADFNQYFATFPTAFLKGPYKVMKKKREWVGDKCEVKNEATLTWSAVHPMDCYPAPGAGSVQDGDFIERLRLTRADLYEMIGLPGYNEEAIRRVLADQQNGSLQAWLWSDMERRRVEGQTNSTWLPDYQIDALHYWGSVQGKDLVSHGITKGVEDPVGYYEVDAIVIGNELIRCELNDDPLGERPYYNASYDPVPGAIWGNSIFELIADCCEMVNACARALNANLALSSGPIMGIDMSQLAAGQDPKAIRPLLQLQLDRSLTTTPRPPIEWYQADSRSADLLSIIQAFEARADELSGIPRYLSGDARASGAAETLGGLSMLMGNAAKGLQRAVANIDRQVIERTLTKVYDYEMGNNPDEDIKGACEIVARGAEAVLVKEHLQQVLSQTLQGVLASEKIQNIMGDEKFANLLRAYYDTLDLPTKDLVPSEEEMQKRMANPGQPQPNPNKVLQAQIDDKKIDSHERISGAKVGADLMKHGLAPPAAIAALSTGQPNGQANGSATPAP